MKLSTAGEASGEKMCWRTDWRICSAGGWASAISNKGRGRHRKAGPPVHDDLVERDFTAVGPNELWLTDIPPQAGGTPTSHWTAEGKLYLCAVEDVYSGRIVGYSIDSRMNSRLAVNVLNSAVARRGDVSGCVLHSDRGSQFRSKKMQIAISRHGLIGSMGWGGACGDCHSVLTGSKLDPGVLTATV